MDSTLVRPQDAPTSSKSVVGTTEEDLLDTQLPQGRPTHDTWFDRHVECRA